MRNIATKADNVGNTLPADGFNSDQNELENIVLSTDQVLDPDLGPDVDLNMLGKAAALYGSAAQFYVDSGNGGDYNLLRSTNLKNVPAYKDGMVIIFKAINPNPGASIVDVNNMGVKNITFPDGSALEGGDIATNGYTIAIFNNTSDRFELLFKPLPLIFTFTALGPGVITGTTVDGIRVAPRDLTVKKISMSLVQSGTAGTTTIDVNVGNSGVAPTTVFTTQANRPSLGFSGNDWQKNEVTNMDITSITKGQIISMDLDVLATGVQDITVQVICV